MSSNPFLRKTPGSVFTRGESREDLLRRLASSRNVFPGGTYAYNDTRRRGGWVQF